MRTGWQNARLSDVVAHRKQFITIDDTVSYKRPRVQLHAQGVVLRDELPGALIKTKTQQVCRSGELLVAEIDAKVGGFGIVPESLDGSIVSSHYFLFAIDDSKLDRRFLDYFVRTPTFRDQVEAQGSTNYAAIRPAHVLGYDIPLPPLPEQQRIVARIEQLAVNIDEARTLRRQSAAEAGALAASHAHRVFAGERGSAWSQRPLGDIAEIRSGVTLGRQLTGATVTLPYLRVANVQDGYLDLAEIKRVEVLESETDKWTLASGDLLLTEGGDWDKLGRTAIWRDNIPHCIHQNHIFRVRLRDGLVPEFVAALIGSPVGKVYFQAASKQTTNLASINQRQLKAFPVPLAPVSQQHRIVEEINALKKEGKRLSDHQMQSAAELDALMPAILDRAFKGLL